MNADPTAIEIRFDPLTQRMKGTAVHGNTPFDVPFISEINGNLWIGGCEDRLILPKHIQHVVSLYPWEQYRIKAPHEIRSVLMVWMLDASGDVDMTRVKRVAHWVNECREDGPTLVHCQAGLNRSSLVTATALVLDGYSPTEAIALLRERRSPAVLCNKDFERAVRAL
jgi:protein-tyrosine phosphatase